MKMQMKKIGKIVAAGTLAGLMFGSTIGFAALDSFPQPFVTSGGVQSLIVIGSEGSTPAGIASDVAGAIDLAARLGGESYTTLTVGGAGVGGTVTGGEGKALYTATTKVFLQDDLGKSGLRTTITKDDMPALLARGSIQDSEGTHKYDQYIDMKPSTSEKHRVDFDKPGSSSTADPTYNLGRFSTSPSTSDYLYATRIVFDVGIDGNSTGKSLKLFGNDYTISADSSAFFGNSGSEKLVLFGGADVKTLYGGESVTVTYGGQTYEVKLIGVTGTNAAAIQVGSQTETVAQKGTSTNFGDLKIYVKDSAQLSTTDQSQNYATLLIGADKLTLQHGQKVKKGTNDDSVDGTYVELTQSSGKLNQIKIYFGATSSTKDYIAVGDATYTNPVFKTFGLNFASIAPAPGGASDDKIEFRNSGDNNVQVTLTDYSGNRKTVNFAYKATSGGSTLSLADNNGGKIHVLENEVVNRDEYIVLDAGGFPHMFKVTGVNLDGTTSASIDLQDVFTGSTTKITVGADNQETAYIDGQPYYFNRSGMSQTNFTVTWGTGANYADAGSFRTVFPTLKTQREALVAFTAINTGPIANNTKIQLPTGAVTLTLSTSGGTTTDWTVTAAAKEDGTTSTATAVSGASSTSTFVFSVGRTATGAVKYNATKVAGAAEYTLTVVGDTETETQPGVLIWEEKDDAGNQAAVYVPTATGTSGSNQLAGIGAYEFTGTNSGSQTWGSNSNKASIVDLWGTLAVRDTSTSAQPIGDIWYPDTQRVANFYVLAEGASVSEAGGGTTTVKTAVPVKTSIAKVDSEVTSADKSNKNLILVGGPAVNSLVRELANSGKTWTLNEWLDGTKTNTAIIQLVDNAFTSGKSALIVAGFLAADTRFAATVLQNYDSHASEFAGKNLVVYKNNVLSTTTA